MSFPKYPAYKDSGVEWLGEVPEHWEVRPLKHLARLTTGMTPPSDDRENYDDTGFPWIRPEDLDESGGITKSSKFLSGKGKALAREVQPGASLICCIGTIGKVGIVDECVSTNQQITAAKFSGSDRFFYLVTCAARTEFEITATGNVLKILNTERLGEVKYPVPPLAEQTAIATFLDHETAKIDALVAEQEKLITLLQEKRQAVISHAVTKGLNPNAPMKDSGVEWLGEVPEHWSCIKLKHLVVESVAGPYGASLTKSMYASSGYRVYGQQQVIADDFSIGDYYISEEKYEEMRRYTVFEGDVLISVMGTIGKVAVVPKDCELGIINPRLVRYRCSDRIQARYMQRVLMSSKHQEHLYLESNGTTMDGLNMLTLGRVPVPTPPIEEQTAILQYINQKLAEYDPLICKAEALIALLQERRTALISAAVTGQIDVRGCQGA